MLTVVPSHQWLTISVIAKVENVHICAGGAGKNERLCSRSAEDGPQAFCIHVGNGMDIAVSCVEHADAMFAC